jgi:hypothetical protein
MESSEDGRKAVGVVFLVGGLALGAAMFAQMWSKQGDVRDATPYPATLLSVTKPECSGSKTKTCRFEAVARIKSPSATIEQPAFAGRYSGRYDADTAHSAHVVGAPTTVYQLSGLRDGYLYYTALGFEQLREESTPRGNVPALLGATIFILIGAGNLLFSAIGALQRRAAERERDAG